MQKVLPGLGVGLKVHNAWAGGGKDFIKVNKQFDQFLNIITFSMDNNKDPFKYVLLRKRITSKLKMNRLKS